MLPLMKKIEKKVLEKWLSFMDLQFPEVFVWLICKHFGQHEAMNYLPVPQFGPFDVTNKWL